MSEWRQLYAEVLDREPPASLSRRVLSLAASSSAVEDTRTGWMRRIVIGVVAAAAVAVVLFVLALAAHSRSSAPPPAGSPIPAPPACAVASGDSGMDCGPASAAIRTAGAWQVIDQGRCVGHTRLYLGVHTANGDAPLSLMLDIPPAVLEKGGDARVTDGRLALPSGHTESLAGRALIAPGGNKGAFTVQGHDSQGHPDRTEYAGAWTCRAGNPSQHARSHQTHQTKRCTVKQPGGYRISCGGASAILWVGGRWQVVFGEDCRGAYHFGNQPNHGPGGRYLWFHADSYIHPELEGKPVQGVSDGGMTVAGTHAAFFGRALFQGGADQTGGAFDLNNRGGIPGNQGGAGRAAPRADYVGAWTCGPRP